MPAKQVAVDAVRARSLGEGLLAQMNRQAPDMPDILWLIREGASMTITGKDGMTPLLKCMAWGNKAVIRAMVEHGADVNCGESSRNVTALQIAVSAADPEIVRLMLGAGGDVLKKNGAGLNALDMARKNPKPEVLSMVEERASAQQAALDQAEAYQRVLRDGLSVEKPFLPKKPFKFKPS